MNWHKLGIPSWKGFKFFHGPQLPFSTKATLLGNVILDWNFVQTLQYAQLTYSIHIKECWMFTEHKRNPYPTLPFSSLLISTIVPAYSGNAGMHTLFAYWKYRPVYICKSASRKFPWNCGKSGWKCYKLYLKKNKYIDKEVRIVCPI